MANITVSTTGNSIVIVFNDYSTIVSATKKSYLITDIVEVELDTDVVVVVMRGANSIKKWYLTYDNTYTGNDYFIIDTVNGVAPTSESDLFDKLTALRG